MESLVIFSLLLAAAFAHQGLDNEGLLPLDGLQNRIAGGQIAKSKQFPYQVRLELTKVKNGRMTRSLCGGSLISNKTILTAAHCLDGATSGIAYLGTSNVRSTEPTRLTLSVWKRDFKIHEKYNSTSMENDIALISLMLPIRFNDGVRSVNLPPASLVSLEHAMGTISGYGKTGTNAPTSNELRFAYRKILPNQNCTRRYPAYFKPQMHVCVDGSQNISTCPGDSGGPIVIGMVDGSKVVVGVTSFGGISCDSGYPVVFTRVTTHLNWINKHTGIPIKK